MSSHECESCASVWLPPRICGVFMALQPQSSARGSPSQLSPTTSSTRSAFQTRRPSGVAPWQTEMCPESHSSDRRRGHALETNPLATKPLAPANESKTMAFSTYIQLARHALKSSVQRCELQESVKHCIHLTGNGQRHPVPRADNPANQCVRLQSAQAFEIHRHPGAHHQ